MIYVVWMQHDCSVTHGAYENENGSGNCRHSVVQVKIWNLLPVVDVQQELNPVMPKLLATLADHYAPVNVAHFSRDGKRLASGAAQLQVTVNSMLKGHL